VIAFRCARDIRSHSSLSDAVIRPRQLLDPAIEGMPRERRHGRRRLRTGIAGKPHGRGDRDGAFPKATFDVLDASIEPLCCVDQLLLSSRSEASRRGRSESNLGDASRSVHSDHVLSSKAPDALEIGSGGVGDSGGGRRSAAPELIVRRGALVDRAVECSSVRSRPQGSDPRVTPPARAESPRSV
jgi:hypothetical protein